VTLTSLAPPAVDAVPAGGGAALRLAGRTPLPWDLAWPSHRHGDLCWWHPDGGAWICPVRAGTP
jgi:hypothetical protein